MEQKAGAGEGEGRQGQASPGPPDAVLPVRELWEGVTLAQDESRKAQG